MKHIKDFSLFSIFESLSIEDAKKYTSITRNKSIQKRLDSIFIELANLEGAYTSKRGDRVYVPFSSSGVLIIHESPVKKEVESALQGTDFNLKDYISGVAVDKFGREIKLGKVLNRIGRTDLVNLFNGDKTREATKKTDYVAVFSKHPYDIAGMSTDRGWTSCMNIYGGENKRYIKWDIKKGSFICYLTKQKDTNLNKPTARILVKPYISIWDKDEVLYSPEPVYGTAPNEFSIFVENVLSKIQGEKVGTFELIDKLYCDFSNTITRYSKKVKDILSGNEKASTREEVAEILESFRIWDYKINADLSVDVKGDVNLASKNISSIPVKFRKVTGSFRCENNDLTSLEGAPSILRGSFICHGNSLTSLKGVTPIIKGDFDCSANILTDLIDSPKEVRGYYDCSDNKIRSLEGVPKKLKDFICSNNPLDSLEGGPTEIGDSYSCGECGLKSLKGSPKEIKGDFDCTYNELKTLEGAPNLVGGDFNCSDNGLKSLKGGPSSVGGDFYCNDNSISSFEEAPAKLGGMFFCESNKGKPSRAQIKWAEDNLDIIYSD